MLVPQFVEALGYKPEGRGFNPRRGHYDLASTWSFRSHLFL